MLSIIKFVEYALFLHTKARRYPAGSSVFRTDVCDNAGRVKNGKSIVQTGLRAFCGVAFSPEAIV